MNKKASRPFEPHKMDFMQDPEYARMYLEDCLIDGNIELFLEALRDVAKAHGGMTELAKNTDLGRESLYKTLSRKGRPQMDTITKILSAFGWRFSIATVERSAYS